MRTEERFDRMAENIHALTELTKSALEKQDKLDDEVRLLAREIRAINMKEE